MLDSFWAVVRQKKEKREKRERLMGLGRISKSFFCGSLGEGSVVGSVVYEVNGRENKGLYKSCHELYLTFKVFKKHQ